MIFSLPLLPHLILDYPKDRDAGKACGDKQIGRDVIAHLAVVELLISCHIEISGSGQAEEDRLLLTGLLTFYRLIHGHLDGVTALRRRKDTFDAGKLFRGGKYIGLFLCVAGFILAGFEHCIADMFYLHALKYLNSLQYAQRRTRPKYHGALLDLTVCDLQTDREFQLNNH